MGPLGSVGWLGGTCFKDNRGSSMKHSLSEGLRTENHLFDDISHISNGKITGGHVRGKVLMKKML